MYYQEKVSLRGISSSTRNSRQKITEIIHLADLKGLEYPFSEEMTDSWIEEIFFPEKRIEERGRMLPDFEYLHKEMAKASVTLSLLHHEYVVDCRSSNKLPYAY